MYHSVYGCAVRKTSCHQSRHGHRFAAAVRQVLDLKRRASACFDGESVVLITILTHHSQSLGLGSPGEVGKGGHFTRVQSFRVFLRDMIEIHDCAVGRFRLVTMSLKQSAIQVPYTCTIQVLRDLR